MSVSEIELGVPIPPSRRLQEQHIQLHAMVVGSSLTVPKRRRGSLSTAIRVQKNKAPGWDFTTRVEGDKIRVWRTA
jgi:hypothetical protein